MKSDFSTLALIFLVAKFFLYLFGDSIEWGTYSSLLSWSGDSLHPIDLLPSW